jgi:hypothetical protein
MCGGCRRRSFTGWLISLAAGIVAAVPGGEVEPSKIQARAAIAAALITSHAVEIPTIPTSGDWSQDTAALRLRDLTDYVYQMITTPTTR